MNVSYFTSWFVINTELCCVVMDCCTVQTAWAEVQSGARWPQQSTQNCESLRCVFRRVIWKYRGENDICWSVLAVYVTVGTAACKSHTSTLANKCDSLSLVVINYLNSRPPAL